MERITLSIIFISLIALWIILCAVMAGIERLIHKRRYRLTELQAREVRIANARRRKMFWEVQADIIPEINKKARRLKPTGDRTDK